MKTQLNGITVNHVERGMPAGSPVVFIHGFPFNYEMWNPQMMALPNSVRAIVYDVRGHGQTEVGDGQFTIDIFVDDLIALLDHLVIDKAVLCGLSMGGYIALRAVERHPDRVRGLILADTRSEADGNEAKIKRTASLKSLKANGVAAFAENFVKAVFWQESFSRSPEAVESIKRAIQGNSPLGIGGTLLALASRTDTSAALANIAVPTLILVGEHDALTPPSASEAMHKAIKGSEMHVLPRAAHMANLENPELFNLKLISFLQQFSA
ncbi:MAG: alpha/beta fold hydrolase [Ignavibacteriales bacterium]|nr:alpha/beta fold hydrolase [Ignavibacteriales bacterium]